MIDKIAVRYLKSILTAVFLCPGFCLIALSQINLCNGNLGDNIFTEGDFGSGSSVIFPSDPGLAPGFQYTTQAPPDDGEYILTNDMAKWANTFNTWIRIGDNSNDPNGYMMVVNASFTPGIFYEQIIDDLCENTLYEFSADIINIIRRNTTGHILPNVSFLINDMLLYTTGEIPQDELWHSHGFTFTTGSGETMLKLTLKNNAPGGVGNDLALDNISFRACGPNSSISSNISGAICENSDRPVLSAHIEADSGSIQWQISLDSGATWTDIQGANERTYQTSALSAGIYFFRYLYSSTSANISNPKCRIISDPISFESVAVEYMITVTLCEGLTYNLGGIEYGEPGIYQEHLIASNGCDSIVTLDLRIVPDPPIVAEFDFSPASCKGAADGTIYIQSVEGIRPPFIFLINDSIIPPPNTLVTLPAGTYIARIENEYGCFYEEEIIVPDGPAFEINTIEDTTIFLGHSVLLVTTANLPAWLSEWTPADGLNCPLCLSTIATPFTDQLYVITAVTEHGCKDSDSVRVRVDRDPVIYIPNVFTPNGDQINDYFEIFSDPSNVRSIEVAIIFDRWGGILSEKANLSNEGRLILWDGWTPKGYANPGVYVYLIKGVLADGTVFTITGDVSILK